MVSLADYQAQSAVGNQVLFGSQTTVEDLDNLNKALTAGSTTGRETANSTTSSGAPLKVESLEKTLKNVTYDEKHAVLWKAVPKNAAFNTVEEYNQLTSYGVDRGGFNREGELPVEEDSTYVRRSQLVKFLGTTRSITHPMTLVNVMSGPVIEREIKNGTLWIMRKVNKALYYANEAIVTEEFNGFLAQHQYNDNYATVDDYFNSDVVIDLRGLPLAEKDFENSANSMVENFGLGDQLYAPPRVISDFVKNFYGNKFIPINTAAITSGQVGQRVQTFESQFGPIGLNKDLFFNPLPNKKTTSLATSPNAANAPTADGVAPSAAVASDAQSKFVTADAGDYWYAVTSINRFGESALTVLGAAAVTIVAGGAADLKFTQTASTYPGTGYRIYRSNKGAATAAAAIFYPLFDLSNAQVTAGYDGAAAGLTRDKNRIIADTMQAILFQFDSEVIDYKQLAPLMKMDLAITSPAFRFMVLMYGTPFLYANKKMIRVINIGRAA